MTYAQTGLIEATDYNNLAWGSNSGGTYVSTATPNLAFIHGTGYGRYGYGQSTSGYAQLSATNIVTATQWTGLLNGINAVLGHQGASAIAPSSVTVGDTITYFSSISTGTSTANTNASTGTVGARTNSTNWTGTSTNYQDGASPWGTGASRTGRFTLTVTWSTADLARYWWNCGGALDLSFSISPTTGTTRIVNWAALLTACGTIRIGYNTATKTGGSGTPSIIRTTPGLGGYWINTGIGAAQNHPGTTTTQFRQFDTATTYTANYVQITTAYSGTTGNGAYPVMTITCDLVNAYVNANQDSVGATPRVTCLIQNPVATSLGTAPTAPGITASWSNI